MTTPQHEQRVHAILDALSGPALSAAQREAILADAATDPKVLDEVRLHLRVDASLKRSFSPPVDLPRRLQDVTNAPAGRTGGAGRMGRAAKWAALIALAGGLAWYAATSAFAPPPVDAPQMYTRLVKAGMSPQVICTTAAEFAKFTNDLFAQPMVIRADARVVALGWNYNLDLFSPKTACLLATVDGSPVVVFMDLLENDARVIRPEDPAVRVFRTRIGRAVLHEVTTKDRPVVSELLFDPGPGFCKPKPTP